MADSDLSGRALGEFVLLEKIGQGGFGAVYRAAQPLLDRHVVVKVLQRNDEVAEQRFLREAKLASRFDHPFVAHLYAFGVDEAAGQPWIAMELVQGVTLSQWLEQHGPMPLEQFVPFFECVADAVHAAHQRGIVHRDLKPSNVMVLEHASRLLPKVLDFGIAKTLEPSPADAADAGDAGDHQDGDRRRRDTATIRLRPAPGDMDRTVTSTSPSRLRNSGDPGNPGNPNDPGNPGKRHRLTRTGIAFGSRPYMSPEQWRDAQAVGPASDVYSLGVLAYEALTGRLPYTADSGQALYRLHRDAEPPSLGVAFPPEFDRVIGRALAKLPEHRQRSPLEMAAEFREAMQAQPREQLRSLARVWNDRERSPELLLRSPDLLHTPAEVIGDLEQAYVAASHRRTVRLAWLRRALVAGAAALALGAGWYALESRAAKRVTEATVTQSELEQGRAALLHGEPDAARHLAEAYRRDQAPSTAFMLARALQPRLAEQARFPSTFGRVWSAAFSPDGTQVVTTDDRAAQLWDAQSNRLQFTLNHGESVYDAVYTSDGTKLITGCNDGAVRIWNPATGALVRELRPAEVTPRYRHVAVSADGKLVAGYSSGASHVWDLGTGALLMEVRTGEPSGVSSLGFSADGRWFAIVTESADVRVMDTQTWEPVHDIAAPGIVSMSWDPTGPRLATGSTDGNVAIWELPSGQRIHHLRDVGEATGSVAFSPDGRRVVAGSDNGDVQVWDAVSGKLQSQGNHVRNRVLSVEFDRTSALVAAASSSGSVAVSEAASGMLVMTLDGPRAVVRPAHFDPTSRRVLAASWDGTARIWGAAAPYRRWRSPEVANDCGIVTGLEPDRRFVAVRCYDAPTRVWDTARDQLVAELPSVTPVGDDFVPAQPAVSAEGDRAAIARGNTIEIYELPTARLLRTIQHRAPVVTVVFAASGRDVVSGATDGSVLVTHDSGVQTALPTTSASIDAVGFLSDGRVVVADAQRRLRIYDLGGVTLADLETRGRVAKLRMAPDGHRLVTMSTFMGNLVAPQLWDTQRFRLVAPLTTPGQAPVYSVRFLANDRLVTGCGDGAFRLWSAETGELRQTYRGGTRFLVDAALSADGTMLIGGGGDGVLRFWDAASARPLWTMPAHRSHLVAVHLEGDDIITRGFSGDVAHWVVPASSQVIAACDRNPQCAGDP